jgi:glutamate-1-semialdehyde aminotransferase
MVKKASAGTSIDYTLLDRQRLSLGQGALTNSKRPSCFVEGVYPIAIDWGRGCEVWDTKGKRYIDFICALGTNLIGYGHTEIVDTIFKQVQRGILFSLGTPQEVYTAERLKGIFPFVDCVKFLKSGSEACTAAVRIARANRPERKLIYSDGYHGWHDEFVSLAPPHYGVMDHTQIGKLPERLEDIDPRACAIILEPVLTDASPTRIEYLRTLRDFCTRHGVLLIFDEIITGFRFPKWSVSTTYGITPDLICLGKAIAGGMPLSVVGGTSPRAPIMARRCRLRSLKRSFSSFTRSFPLSTSGIRVRNSSGALTNSCPISSGSRATLPGVCFVAMK